VAVLQRDLWSSDLQLNAAHLDWKYLQNPYLAEPLIYLAFVGSELVGMRGVFGSCWEAGGDRFILPYADDLVIAASHRGRWLHQRIMAFVLNDLAARGYRHVVNLSASRATALGSIRMRWRSSGGVRPVHRCTPRKVAVDRLTTRMRQWTYLWRWTDRVAALCLPGDAHTFERLDRRFAQAGRARSSVFVQDVPLVGEMARLAARLPNDGRIRHVRDETYLAWRYRHPLRSYRFLYAGGERLNGYLVLQRPLGLHRGRVSIVDWEADDDRVRAALLAAAVDGGFAELYAWAAAVDPAAERMLGQQGFVADRSEYEKTVLTRALRDEDFAVPWRVGGRHLDDARDWDLRMIYSMVG
jgi:ribosomal protein S18 acetylase RimI-like enzyme